MATQENVFEMPASGKSAWFDRDGDLLIQCDSGLKFIASTEVKGFAAWLSAAVNPAPAKPPGPATAETTILDNDETTITREVFYRFVDKQTDEEVWLNAGEMRALHAAATK